MSLSLPVQEHERRLLSNDVPPWHAVHDQTRRWLRAAILDSRTLRSIPESGHRAGFDGANRKTGSKIHAAVDTLGHLLALHLNPADADYRAEVGRLAKGVQAATGESVQVAFVDGGYVGQKPAEVAAHHGIQLEGVKLPKGKGGFVLLPRRWVIGRSFAWATRSRRLVRDDEQLPQTVAGLHFIAVARLMLHRVALAHSP